VCGRWIGNQETKKWTRGGVVIGWRGSSIIFGPVCPCALLVSPSQANTSHSLTGKSNVVTTKLKFLKNCTENWRKHLQLWSQKFLVWGLRAVLCGSWFRNEPLSIYFSQFWLLLFPPFFFGMEHPVQSWDQFFGFLKPLVPVIFTKSL